MIFHDVIKELIVINVRDLIVRAAIDFGHGLSSPRASASISRKDPTVMVERDSSCVARERRGGHANPRLRAGSQNQVRSSYLPIRR